jgi:predicted ribosome quality control (RQC) complex YloA/Tae2 family protein
MFKVGEYYEDEAKSIAGYLRDAGFKVDIKGLVQARTDITASLQGRHSELKGKIDAFERYERFLAAIKSAVEKGATQESFRDLFLTMLDQAGKKRVKSSRNFRIRLRKWMKNPEWTSSRA